MLISTAQLHYLTTLVEARIGRKLTTYEVLRAQKLSRRRAGKIIARELELRDERLDREHNGPGPDRETEAAKTPPVPDGRYAVMHGDGVLRFYKVNTPTEGRWDGFTFVQVQASDELHPVRNRSQRMAVLDAIADDPQSAAERYGREIGECGVCGRTLTDEASRARGIGPICADKRGW